jgi:hypothetical protein
MAVAPNDDVLIAVGNRIMRVASGGAAVRSTSADVGAVAALALTAIEEIVALAGGSLRRLSADGQTEIWATEVGRSQLRGLAVSPATGDIFVSGDTNTHTGHEPYRSPYLFRYSNSGEKLHALYDWSGPDVRQDGRMLQADSSLNGADNDGSQDGGCACRAAPSTRTAASSAVAALSLTLWRFGGFEHGEHRARDRSER